MPREWNVVRESSDMYGKYVINSEIPIILFVKMLYFMDNYYSPYTMHVHYNNSALILLYTKHY